MSKVKMKLSSPERRGLVLARSRVRWRLTGKPGGVLSCRLPSVLVIVAVLAVTAGATAATAATAPSAVPAGRVLPEVPVTAVDLRVGQANNSPVLLADPTNDRVLALASRIDGPDFGCALHISVDGGRLWSPARPVPTLPVGAEKCYAPEMAFDRDGLLYYLFVGLQGLGNTPMGVFLTTSGDRGRTFSVPRPVLGPKNFQVRMVLDPDVGSRGRLHLVWLQVTGDLALGGLPPTDNPLLAAHSDDGGMTFSEPVRVNDVQRRLAVAPAVAVGTDHALHVLYYDLQQDRVDYQGLEGATWSGTWSLVLASSTDRGMSFGPGVVVDDQIVPPERVILIFTMAPPALVADRSDRLYAAWTDGRNGDWDVLVRRSVDAGRTWDQPVIANGQPGDGRHQYLPRLAVSPGGRLDAVFYDRRDDPANLRNDVSYTSLSEDGRRFVPVSKLTAESSNPLVGPRYAVPSAKGLVDVGSRLALLAVDSGAVTAWADTRNAIGDADAESGPRTQDILATRVELSLSAASSRPWAWPVLVTLTITVLAGALWVLRRRSRDRGPVTVGLPEGEQPAESPGPPTSRLVAVAAVGGVLLLTSSCQGGVTDGPPKATVVDVTMGEYRFDVSASPPAGRVVFRARNAGALDHQLVMVVVPEDLPITFAEQVVSPVAVALPTFAYLPARKPGQTGILAVDLAPGRYAFGCFLKDERGESHARKGMSVEFRVA